MASRDGISRRDLLKAGAGVFVAAGLSSALAPLAGCEHWNNTTDKQYSRNLGADEGIELARVDL